MEIPFNKMAVVGNEEKYLLEALRSGKWVGRGPKTLALEKLVRDSFKVRHAFFVTSGSSALEASCLTAQLNPGDEVILPSFGFVSAANAVILAGAKPVFADIDLETWNLSAETVEAVLSPKTKAIITIHYAGSSAGVEDLRKLCKSENIFLIEDAAQSIGARRDGVPIGSTPWTACFSLHETKNFSSGEGGLLTTDSDRIAEHLEIQVEKGTNRQKFFRGQVDKYTWVDRGSSYIASDLLAAVALGQLEKINEVTARRRNIFSRLKQGLSEFSGLITWQKVPKGIETNGHVAGFRIDVKVRDTVLKNLKNSGVQALFHYVPLHDSPYAKEHGLLPKNDLPNTRTVSEGLVRLPIYFSMTDDEVETVITKTSQVLRAV